MKLNLLSKFKKAELPASSVPVEVVPALSDAPVVVAVPDIKEYLVKEYERARELVARIEELEKQLEEAELVRDQYKAAMVTLEEYSGRAKSAETKLSSERQKTAAAKEETKKALDKINSYKILMNNAALTKEEIKEEVVDEVKKAIIDEVAKLKGNLSKKIVYDLIEGVKL